jgi:hypothetical protein
MTITIPLWLLWFFIAMCLLSALFNIIVTLVFVYSQFFSEENDDFEGYDMKAIDKVKKLLSLSKSPNQNEAAAALAKVIPPPKANKDFLETLQDDCRTRDAFNSQYMCIPPSLPKKIDLADNEEMKESVSALQRDCMAFRCRVNASKEVLFRMWYANERGIYRSASLIKDMIRFRDAVYLGAEDSFEEEYYSWKKANVAKCVHPKNWRY